jgi:O-antigen/teichoic acid export membrane protein
MLVLAASLAAQIYLGRLLSKRDFGIYAIAISFSNMLMVFRDGGVARWLARMPRDEFDTAAPKAICLTYLSSLAVAAAVVVMAFIVGALYALPEITPVMLVLALAFPISAYAVVGLARLQVDLKFQQMATLKFTSGMIRYGLIVLLAFLGFGPMSFAWPVVVVAVFELIMFVWITRMPIQPSAFTLSSAREVFQNSKWSLSGSFSSAIMRQCDYAVLGLIVPTEIVGAYYFAFQLAMQPVNLFGESLRKVILPVFSRIEGDLARENRSLRYAGTFIGLLAAPLLLLLSVTAHPLTEILWQGKWQSAVVPLQLLCLAMPVHLLSVFAEALTQSRGRFRLWTFAILLRGIGLGCVAWLAGTFANNNLATIALIMSSYLALSAIVELYVLLRQLKLPPRPLFQVVVLPLISASGIATLLVVLGEKFNGSPALTFVLLSVGFIVLFAVSMWWFCRDSVYELTSIVRRTAKGS